jgi:hypothetical protein
MENKVILTKENIHACKSQRGGFTNAQIEYLGFKTKEKWLKNAIGNSLSQDEFEQFKKYGDTRANVLRRLKKDGIFKPLNY